MSARLTAILTLSLGLAACATTAPAPDSLQIVQLSLSATPEPCDWSGQYEPYDVPDQFSLGATYWPHTMPRPKPWNRKAEGPLTLYGTITQFVASETSPVICLRLFKRASSAQTGIGPVAVVEILPEAEAARVTAVRLDKRIQHLELGFTTEAPAQAVIIQMVGGRFVELPPKAASPNHTPSDASPIHRLSLDMRRGRAEGRLPNLTFSHSTRLGLVASPSGHQDQGQKVLETLLTQALRGSSEARFEDQTLIIRPRPAPSGSASPAA